MGCFIVCHAQEVHRDVGVLRVGYVWSGIWERCMVHWGSSVLLRYCMGDAMNNGWSTKDDKRGTITVYASGRRVEFSAGEIALTDGEHIVSADFDPIQGEMTITIRGPGGRRYVSGYV